MKNTEQIVGNAQGVDAKKRPKTISVNAEQILELANVKGLAELVIKQIEASGENKLTGQMALGIAKAVLILEK